MGSRSSKSSLTPSRRRLVRFLSARLLCIGVFALVVFLILRSGLMCARHILASTSYFASSPYLVADNLPENNTTSGLAEGLAKAHDAYGVRGSVPLPWVQHYLTTSIQRSHPVRRATERT